MTTAAYIPYLYHLIGCPPFHPQSSRRPFHYCTRTQHPFSLQLLPFLRTLKTRLYYCQRRNITLITVVASRPHPILLLILSPSFLVRSREVCTAFTPGSIARCILLLILLDFRLLLAVPLSTLSPLTINHHTLPFFIDISHHFASVAHPFFTNRERLRLLLFHSPSTMPRNQNTKDQRQAVLHLINPG